MLATARRIVAGLILLGLGLLLAVMRGQGPGMVQAPIALLAAAAWIGCAIALLFGVGRARVAGLGASVVGLALGLLVALQGVDSPDILLGTLFSAQDATRWYVVMPAGWLFAVASAVAGALLVVPFSDAPEPR